MSGVEVRIARGVRVDVGESGVRMLKDGLLLLRWRERVFVPSRYRILSVAVALAFLRLATLRNCAISPKSGQGEGREGTNILEPNLHPTSTHPNLLSNVLPRLGRREPSLERRRVSIEHGDQKGERGRRTFASKAFNTAV